MPYAYRILDNADAVLEAAREELERRLAEGALPVLLLPSSDAAAQARRALADTPCAFGVRVETLSSWVEERWELYGDGRRVVSAVERPLLLGRACAEASSGALAAGAGTVELLARLARAALPCLPEAARVGSGLSEAERSALAVLERYAQMLLEGGLCELSQAAAALPAALPAPAPVVLALFDELDAVEERLVSALAESAGVLRLDDGCRAPDRAGRRAPELQDLLSALFDAPRSGAVQPRGSLRLLLPAGRYAAPALVADAVLGAVRAERDAALAQRRPALDVVVAARDPRALFDLVAQRLAAEGAVAGVAASRSFADTAFGRAFLALCAFVQNESAPVEQASDFALSVFSGMSPRAARRLDARWRSDRTIGRARMIDDMRQASGDADAALAALFAGDADAALAVFEARLLRNQGLEPAFRSEQLAALSCARGFAAACAAAGSSFGGSLALLERLAVAAGARTDLSKAASKPKRPEVLFVSLEQAAQRGPCSCATLVLCDLNASDYPVRHVEDGASLLLEKLGLARPPDALARARRCFFRALSTACDAVVCERALNTADADAAYPAVMFEELLDCYRALADGPGEDTCGLPASLAAHALTAGEDALHENLALEARGGPRGEGGWEAPAFGSVSQRCRRLIVLPGPPVGDEDASALVLSPSAIESYLECPYKWFAVRRLRISEADAGFGPLEMGSFSHAVLKSFYERFREAGHAKLLPSALEEARGLVRQIFACHLARQAEIKPSRKPLIPLTPYEQAETRDLEKGLLAYLEREARLLPGFEPSYFEYEFGSAQPCPYAGCLVRGCVDRIDVNERGQAVIIDYKGSVGADYALESMSPVAQAGGALLPHKVQTLVYAQVARRVLGLDVVGALYVSYGRDGRVSGAFDRGVLGAQDVPGIDPDRCGVPGPAAESLGAASFAELVDRVEEAIAQAARILTAGDIAPDPRGKDPCGYCPVLSCEKRREA